jgi:hypothetical protein
MGTPPVWETYEERARIWRVKWAGARARARIVVSDRARDRVRERRGIQPRRRRPDFMKNPSDVLQARCPQISTSGS